MDVSSGVSNMNAKLSVSERAGGNPSVGSSSGLLCLDVRNIAGDSFVYVGFVKVTILDD